MKTQLIKSAKYITTFCMLFFANIIAFAQESPQVSVNGHDVGNWFSRNWVWVVAIIVVLLLIAVLGMGNSSSRRTTVVRKNDNDGNFTRTTTSTVIEE